MAIPGKQLTRLSGLLLLAAALTGCAAAGPAAGKPGPVAPCYAIYDAGSSGTRLDILQQTGYGWVRHAGPTAGPLADPARRNRGKTMQDADSVTAAIAALLEAIRHPGPADSRGVPRWHAFDWHKRCDLKLLAVYATGGMRLAEKEHPGDAAALWAMLKRQLSGRVGAPVEARTLSGFEEGLYAWLSVRATRKDGLFGIVDMGGASAQITFPCADCSAPVSVRVGRNEVPIVSASFLGLGQDEVWKRYGSRPSCRLAAGKLDDAWRASQCTHGIALTDGAKRLVDVPVRRADARHWYLGGAFRYRRDGDAERYCRSGEKSDFQPQRACFRTLYQLYFLHALGVPPDATRVHDDWTLGAAVCRADDCLAAAG